MSKIEKQLPLKLQNDFRTYLFLALPMCVASTEEKLANWFYENFINIYITSLNDFLYIGFDFNNGGVFDPFETETIWDYRIPSDRIMDTIYQSLMTNRYCYLFLDEYYLESSKYYHVTHFIHDSLIYGFDPSSNAFMAVAMNRRSTLARLLYPLDSFQKAYESSASHRHHDLIRPVVFFQLKEFQDPYHFSLTRFLKNLEDYLNSKDATAQQFMKLPQLERKGYGMSAVQYYIGQLKRQTYFGFDTFRSLYFLFEHKKGLYRRFQFLSTRYASQQLDQLISSFETVVDQYNSIRMLMMKYQDLSAIKEFQKKRSVIQVRIIDLLTAALSQEKFLLEQILEELKRFLHIDGAKPPTPPNLAAKRPTQIVFSQDSRYSYHAVITYRWNNIHRLHCLKLAKRSRIRIITDATSVTYSSVDEDNQVKRTIDLGDQFTRSLTIDIGSHFPIQIDDLDIRIFETNLLKGKHISASSTWENETGEMDVDYSPEKAVDDCPTTFWNAGHRWKPGDHLEVTFSSPQLIDCLMLKERPDLQRIREYSLTYQNTNGEWQEIVRHKGGLNGKMMQHRFAPICAVKLRFVLWKTVEVPSASNESGLSHFEAYCNE